MSLFQSLLTGTDIIGAFKARVAADTGTFEGEQCLRSELNEFGTFYKKFGIILTPNGYKANKIYALKPINGDGDLATVRASTATRRDYNEKITAVSTGFPRLNTRLGFTCAEQLTEFIAGTNLILRSEEIDNASWTKTNCTVVADAVSSPGTTNADSVLETVTSGQHRIEQAISKSTVTLDYTLTFHIKPNGRDWIYASLRNGGNGMNVWFNIATVTRGTPLGFGSGWTFRSSEIIDIGDGWRKVSIIVQTDSTNSVMSIIACATDNANNANFAGDTAKGFYIWGVQLEQGISAGSYIPTTSTSATRNSDTITTKTALSSYLGSTEGSIYFQGFVNFDGVSKRISLTDGTTAKRVMIIFGTDNKARFYVENTTIQCDITASDVYRSDSMLRVLCIYAANRAELWVNGVKVGEDLTVSVPSGLDRLSFSDSSLNFSGSWKVLAISNQALSAVEAAAISAPVSYPPIIKKIIQLTLQGNPDYYGFGNGLDLNAYFADYSIYIAKRGPSHYLDGGNLFGMLYNAKFNLWTSVFQVIDSGTTYYSGVSAGLVGNQIFIQVARYTVSGGVDTFADIGYVTSVDLTTLSSVEDLKLSSSWSAYTPLPTPTYTRYESYGKLLPSTAAANTYYVPWYEHNGTLHSLHVRKIVRNAVNNFTITNQTIINATTEVYYEQCIVHCGGNNWLCFASKASGTRKIRLFSSTDDTASWTDIGDTNLGSGSSRCIIDAVFYNNQVHVYYQDRGNGFMMRSIGNSYAQCLTLSLNTPVAYAYNAFNDSTNGLGYPSVWEIRSGVFYTTFCKEASSTEAHIFGTLDSL